jgi:hypothetical protein
LQELALRDLACCSTSDGGTGIGFALQSSITSCSATTFVAFCLRSFSMVSRSDARSFSMLSWPQSFANSSSTSGKIRSFTSFNVMWKSGILAPELRVLVPLRGSSPSRPSSRSGDMPMRASSISLKTWPLPSSVSIS